VSKDAAQKDAFIQMVTAKAAVDLPLSDYHPQSMLVVPTHEVRQAKFPAIDYHNHLDAQDPQAVLRIMDECGIEVVVNITMRVGREGIDMIRKFRAASPDRFETYGWMDWSDLHAPGFFERAVDRLEELINHGARGLKIWKDLGTSVVDANGQLLCVDDERLAPLFEKAAELNIPVMFHTSDPDAFFLPIDPCNERYEELAAHPDWSFSKSHFSKQELLAQRDRVFARHRRTTFVAAHVAERSEDLEYVSRLLDACPNLYVDISARASELGRQPYTARNFFLRYSDRILFGSDLVPEREMYRLYFRFLETDDQYFEYPSHASRQGRWNIYGLFLPDEVLRRVYRDNACRLLKRPA
jgi:predicted TIM-barrel fold metal-dependent hydrolase